MRAILPCGVGSIESCRFTGSATVRPRRLFSGDIDLHTIDGRTPAGVVGGVQRAPYPAPKL